MSQLGAPYLGRPRRLAAKAGSRGRLSIDAEDEFLGYKKILGYSLVKKIYLQLSRSLTNILRIASKKLLRCCFSPEKGLPFNSWMSNVPRTGSNSISRTFVSSSTPLKFRAL